MVVPKVEGLAPIQFDIQLTPAQWLEGQVTDAVTGKALQAMVSYYPHLDNPAAENHEAFLRGLRSFGYDDLLPTDAAGRFRIPVLSGRGVLRVVAADHSEYELMYSDNQKTGLYMDSFGKVGMGILKISDYYHIGAPGNAMVGFDLPKSDEPTRADVKLQPVKSAPLHVTDSEGKSVTGFRMAGRVTIDRATIAGIGNRYWEDEIFASTDVSVLLDDKHAEKRPLMFHHKERQLGAAVTLKEITPDATGIRHVALRPLATVTGKLIEGGQPIVAGFLRSGKSTTISVNRLDARGQVAPPSTMLKYYFEQALQTLDGAGTFRCKLPAGTDNKIEFLYRGKSISLISELTVAPGETVDLGTIDVKANPETWPTPKRLISQVRAIADYDKRLVFRGTVRDENEKVSRRVERSVH